MSALTWRSHKLRWKAPYSLSAEAQGVGESAAVLDFLRCMWLEAVNPELKLACWETKAGRLAGVIATDCKSVYDELAKPLGPSVSTIEDRRTAIDLCLVKDAFRDRGVQVRWIEGTVQLADSLTKLSAKVPGDRLKEVLRGGR